MPRYYTRACNFYYGKISKNLVKDKKSLPLNGNKNISFNQIEIISRKSKKKISIKQINKLPNSIKQKIKKDLKFITKPPKKIYDLNFKFFPLIMGILNITPDSFSDGGDYLKKESATKQLNKLFKVL